MAYATIEDVQARITRTLTTDEERVCPAMLDDAGALIDAWNADAPEDAKKIVSCNMVIRALSSGEDSDIPFGATQGSRGALGYTESWTVSSGGSIGEMYLTKNDKRLLRVGNRIGAYSPVEEMVCAE